MSIQVNLEGLQSGIAGEERALMLLKVTLNNVNYNWARYVPPDNNLDLSDLIESLKSSIQSEIEFKENQWTNLSPKTRQIINANNEEETIDIGKEEIVSPDVPDYYARRRVEYPSIGEQLDAVWKGVNSQAYAALQAKIEDVKTRYPKPSWL